MGLNTDFFDRESDCEYRFKRNAPFWHICTPGENQTIIFQSNEDYHYGITALGLAKAKFHDVEIYTYALMSNHLHLILSGTKEQCIQFIQYYKRLLMIYFSRTKQLRNLASFDEAQCIAITDLRMLRNEIAYVNRNGFVEYVCPTPFAYEWGCGRYYFTIPQPVNREFNTLTIREKRAILHKSDVTLPDNYTVDEKYLDPRSFCNFHKGELYYNPEQQYFIMLSRNFEAFSAIAERLGDQNFLTDNEIYPAACMISNSEFGVKTPSLLPSEDKIKLVRILHDKYHASNKQIARVVSIPVATINQLYPLAANGKQGKPGSGV